MRVIIIGRGKMGTLLKDSASTHGHEVIAMADAANQDEVKPLECDAVIDFSHPDNLACRRMAVYTSAARPGSMRNKSSCCGRPHGLARCSIQPISLMASPCWRRCWNRSRRC